MQPARPQILTVVLLWCVVAQLVSARSCPFSGMFRKAKAGVTLENSQIVTAAKTKAADKFCGAPLCNPAAPAGRKLLSNANVKMHSNGYPELYEGTVQAIETDFCALLPGGCNLDSSDVSKGMGLNDYNADFSRCDIVAGAIQLAFHDAGEYDPNNSTYPGGPDGCACDKKLENVGLDYIKGVLAPVYDKYSSYLSLGDFWAICGNTAVMVSRPNSVEAATVTAALDFKYGRPDHSNCDNCLAEVADRLPNAELSIDHVLDVFQTRMGFTNTEIVALMGAHSLGRMEMTNSGHEGIWDQTCAKLDTRYFVGILSFRWCRYVVDETGTPYEEHGPFHEWREAGQMDEAADYYTNSTPKLLNTDMALAFAIGDEDAVVNTETCPTACMQGTFEGSWNENGAACSDNRVEGQTVTFCKASTASPDSPSGSLEICYRNTKVPEMAELVSTYAADSEGTTFMPVFAAAWKKLTELGVSDLTSPTAGSCMEAGTNCIESSTQQACCDSSLNCYPKSRYYGLCLTADEYAEKGWDYCIDTGSNCVSGGEAGTCCDSSLTCYYKGQYYGKCLTAEEYAEKGWTYSANTDEIVPEFLA